MKKLFVAICLLVTTSIVFAQDADCDDPNKIACCQAGNAAEVKITPLSELKCAKNKGHLYNILPNIPIYKGFLFNQVNHCGDTDTKAKTLLEFEYCIAKTRQHMTITIVDFTDDFYKTDAGKAQQNFYQTLFQAGTSPFLKTYPSNNKKFSQSLIAMPDIKGDQYVTFEGLKDNRFYVHITVDGDRFKTSTEVDAFLADYIKEFAF